MYYYFIFFRVFCKLKSSVIFLAFNHLEYFPLILPYLAFDAQMGSELVIEIACLHCFRDLYKLIISL